MLVLYSLGVYILYVLLPLIPAILIYRLFPSENIRVKGIMGQLKINASGAFAGYIIIMTMGYFIVKNTINLINEMPNLCWNVKANVEYQDYNGKKLEMTKPLTGTLNIEIIPDYNSIGKTKFNLKLPRYEKERMIKCSLDGFLPAERMLEKTDDEVFNIDYDSREIDLGTIILKKLLKPLNPYNPPGKITKPDSTT